MMDDTNFGLIKIGTEPLKFEIISEIYLVFSFKKYVPAIDIFEVKTKRKHSFIVSASSVATALEKIRTLNNGTLLGTVAWFHRESEDKMAKYVVEVA